MRKKLHLFMFLMLVSTVGFGQVKFTVELSKSTLGVNERLRVEFKMNQDGDHFVPPSFDGFRVYGGPFQRVWRTYVNGKGTFQKTYTYYLQPKRKGKLTIGQAEVKIDGKTYKTSPKTVTVTAAVSQPKDGNNQTITKIKGIHVVAEVSDAHPYLNEGITVTYKLYVESGQSVSDWRALNVPSFSNFWSQEIKTSTAVKYGVYNGDRNYRYVVLKKTVLYPQKTGKLKISPYSMSVAVAVPTNRRNFFGQPVYKSVRKTISSRELTIDVKPLPTQGQPANFTGAVGHFKFKVEATKDKLESGESMDVKLEASGNGNLKLFQLPKLQMPNAFEVYDPEHSVHANTNASGTHGNITDTYTLVPDAKGSYTIAPIAFSYFDPDSKQYKTIRSKPIHIQVTQGAITATTPNTVTTTDSTLQRKQQVLAERHFRYIKLKTDLQPLQKSPFFTSKLFWILLFLPVVLLPVAIIIGRKRRAQAQDFYANRLKRANRLAKKYLSEAKKRLGDQKAYYEALERALHNYLKAKLAIQTSEMSKERIMDLLRDRNVTEETGTAFIKLLESCEFARYAPSSEVAMQQDYDKAARIISEVDKQLKA